MMHEKLIAELEKREKFFKDTNSIEEAEFMFRTAAALRELQGTIAELRAKLEKCEEALKSMCHQYAYDTTTPNGPAIYTGGMSALEEAFDALGWVEPHPLEDEKCETDGCNKRATCGTPTPDGYKRLCGGHYQALAALKEDKHE